ncbi:glutamate 5-kinase [Thalassotalea insulae]|uniref:Glutamate 5-kinase n=1 Tax=Thalassotalea insulae TaxID=2056778 RepID=A0ABQ6GYV6_9GAMM|nr:glutamate 5-kinase [Thalassotalea insulae]GLX80509.1 glutamate 5-kinase [Thalassotalea insulae]
MANTNSKGKWNRIVLKVGSALIAPNKKGCSSRYLLGIADFIVKCRMHGTQVVLVSSGSVAAGSSSFDTSKKRSIAVKKAMAAKGQMEMMASWDRLFDFEVAQLLLTQGDLQIHERYESIRETAFELLNNDILPIVNENDAVTSDEQKVGDNDNLSAMIAAAVDAECLIICSDVEGLYTDNPNTNKDAVLLKEVEVIDDRILAMASGPDSAVGTGGMRTKLEAAEKATSNGILTYIVNGLTTVSFNQLFAGNNPGTKFLPFKQPLDDRIHWMTHTSKAQGEVIVSNEIGEQVEDDALSFDHSDIVNVVGDFSSGETILVRTEKGKKLAKATSQHSSCVLNLMLNEDVDESAIEWQEDNPIISENTLAILEEK